MKSPCSNLGRLRLAAMLLFCGCFLAAEGSSAAGSTTFEIYDGTSYRNKPNLVRYGIQPVYILTEGKFWDKKTDQSLPDAKRVKKAAADAASKGLLTIIDIERWKMWAGVGVEENVPKYVGVLKKFKESAPNLRVGYYATAPQGSYGTAQVPSSNSGYRRWMQLNDSLRPIANLADAVFPSIYTYSTNREAWKRFALAQVNEARRYGKPVYAFIWPQYVDNAPDKSIALKWLPEDFWRFQLDTLSGVADGVVIWGGWDFKGWRAIEWDDSAPWWGATKDFIARIPQK
ncbi:MAG: hypothetical protein HY749_18045 [Gammaproteobacteria bacterium]|nr:hypothetical protein [Gammaproteobacteria bacterium]